MARLPTPCWGVLLTIPQLGKTPTPTQASEALPQIPRLKVLPTRIETLKCPQWKSTPDFSKAPGIVRFVIQWLLLLLRSTFFLPRLVTLQAHLLLLLDISLPSRGRQKILSGRFITRQMTRPHFLRKFVLLRSVRSPHLGVETPLLPQALSKESSPPCRKATPVPTPSLTLGAPSGATLTVTLALSPCTELTPVSSAPQAKGGISMPQRQSTLAAPEPQQPIESSRWPLNTFKLVLVPNARPILYPKLGPTPRTLFKAIIVEPFIGIILPGSINLRAAHELTLPRPFVNLQFICSPRPLIRGTCPTNLLLSIVYVVDMEGKKFYPRPSLNPEEVLAWVPMARTQWLVQAQPKCFTKEFRRGLLQQEPAFL